jgi:agmatine deiminase
VKRRGALMALAAGLAGCAGDHAAAPDAATSDTTGWRLVGEFEPQPRALWLAGAAGHDTITAGLVAALHRHVPLRCLVQDAAAEQRTRALLNAQGPGAVTIDFVHEPLASFFVRDLAVFARGPAGASGLVDLRWTQYGVPAWCERRHAGDAAEATACAQRTDLAREGFEPALARALGLRLLRSGVAAEGGGIEANGAGLLIANEALFRSRHPGLALAQIEARLLRLPGIEKVIWLPEGLAEDPLLRATITGDHIAWGTGGHTDEFVRFAGPRTVLLAWPDDDTASRHPVARITRARMERNLRILEASTDVHGQPLQVLKVPMPRPIERRVFLSAMPDPGRSRQWSADHFPPAEQRWQGQPLTEVAVASWLNFVLAPGVVVLPDYRPHGSPRALHERVVRVFEQAFPGRELHFVDAISANWVGGGLHCATLNQG